MSATFARGGLEAGRRPGPQDGAQATRKEDGPQGLAPKRESGQLDPLPGGAGATSGQRTVDRGIKK
jgi:hypothetical protein